MHMTNIKALTAKNLQASRHHAQLVMWGLWGAVVPMKVVWRYADTPDPGAQSVTLAGAALMLVSSADSWDLYMKVHSYNNIIYMQYIIVS